MKRNLYRCTLAVLMLTAWAMAQTPAQSPQQTYPTERPSAQQTIPPQQQPSNTPNQQAYPEENPHTPAANATPQSNVNVAPQTAQPQALNSDESFKKQLQRTLAVNPRLSDVQPVVNGGQVTLTGTVPTEADRADAKRMIEEAAGVNKVTDEMTIGTTSHMPPGGNASESTALPQGDVYGKGSTAQGAAHGCQCQKGQNSGKYPGTDEPCACSGTTTHSGESLPKSASPTKPPR